MVVVKLVLAYGSIEALISLNPFSKKKWVKTHTEIHCMVHFTDGESTPDFHLEKAIFFHNIL